MRIYTHFMYCILQMNKIFQKKNLFTGVLKQHFSQRNKIGINALKYNEMNLP